MRIIGGRARGTKLYTLEGENTRPTLDRVRESLFNIIQNKVPDSVFLDVFAGSGAIGIEAVSRGAKKSILCDKNKEAIKIIEKNIEKTHSQENIELYNLDCKELLQCKIKEKVDIVYIDPPYKTDLAYETIKLLLDSKILDKESLMIVETDEEKRIIKQIENLQIEIIDKRKYGRAHLIFIKRK